MRLQWWTLVAICILAALWTRQVGAESLSIGESHHRKHIELLGLQGDGISLANVAFERYVNEKRHIDELVEARTVWSQGFSLFTLKAEDEAYTQTLENTQARFLQTSEQSVANIERDYFEALVQLAEHTDSVEVIERAWTRESLLAVPQISDLATSLSRLWLRDLLYQGGFAPTFEAEEALGEHERRVLLHLSHMQQLLREFPSVDLSGAAQAAKSGDCPAVQVIIEREVAKRLEPSALMALVERENFEVTQTQLVYVSLPVQIACNRQVLKAIAGWPQEDTVEDVLANIVSKTSIEDDEQRSVQEVYDQYRKQLEPHLRRFLDLHELLNGAKSKGFEMTNGVLAEFGCPIREQPDRSKERAELDSIVQEIPRLSSQTIDIVRSLTSSP